MALTTVKSDQIQTSVALAGSPTTTTQSASDNSTKVATTAYADTAVANLVASAPAALNTLDELAAALNDDASFSTTITNSIATKLPLAGGTLTGNVFSGNKTGLTDTNTGHAIAPGGLVYHTTDGTLTQSLNRLTDDGPVLRFVGNNTTAGSIGVVSGGLSLGSGSSMTTRMVINSSGNISTSSNFSVGTTNTSQFVTILKDHTGYTDIGVSNNTSNSDLYLGVGGSGAGNTDLRNAAYVLAGGASSSLVLGTNTDEKMRIDASGRVGINTTPTVALLEVVRSNNDTYTPTAFLENQQIRIKHPNATNNYGGIGFSNSGGNYEWFAGSVQTGASTADFIIQGADSTSTYSEVFRINSQGTVTVPGSLTAQNVINIATDGSAQTTSARQWATIKNTGTGTGDYSEMRISNDNNDYIIMGSIGSNYNTADWSNSSYIYANRELRIKSAAGIRFFVGGMNINSHDRMYLDSNGHLTLTGGSSGGSASIIRTVDGAGDQEILRIGRIGGASSNGERRASISFYDSANTTYTAKISGYRENPAGNYNGGLKFYVNPHSVNANATFAELDNTPAMYLRPDRSMEIVAGHVIMPNGYGIHFGATPAPINSASASSTVLDDYEEGTWTPTLPNGGSITNYKSTYTKIGRLVYLYCYCYITPTNNGSGLQIGGMPYKALNVSNYHPNGSIGYSATVNTSAYYPLTYYNQSFLYFHRTDGSSATLKNNGIYVGGGNLLMTITYETDA